MFFNRVSGIFLKDLQMVGNMTFLPGDDDQLMQRWNYIVLISRMLVEYFSALQPLKDACMQHIPNKYWKELLEKSGKAINNNDN